jgi:O-succinylbenzoate synthase
VRIVLNQSLQINRELKKYKTPVYVKGDEIHETWISKIHFYNSLQELMSGEINFLPNFHLDSLDKKESSLRNILNTYEINSKIIKPMEENFGLNFLKNESFETQFTIESIILNSFKGLFFTNKSSDHIFYNTLLKKIDSLSSASFIKLKINPTLCNDNLFFNELNLLLQKETLKKIRFDANKTFSLPQLLKFASKVDSKYFQKIEYFEDCLLNPKDAIEFEKQTSLHYAYDESLIDILSNIISPLEKSFIVIKPSLYGVGGTKNLIDHFSQYNINCIISSTYESISNVYALLYLAFYSDQVSRTKNIHGLDLSYLFQTELIKNNSENNSLQISAF